MKTTIAAVAVLFVFFLSLVFVDARVYRYEIERVPGTAVKDTENLISYKVRPGNTLFGLAIRFGTTPDQIRQWNLDKIVNIDKIRAGWTLRFKLPDQYRVRKGDALSVLSGYWGLSAKEIQKRNAQTIRNPDRIFIGAWIQLNDARAAAPLISNIIFKPKPLEEPAASGQTESGQKVAVVALIVLVLGALAAMILISRHLLAKGGIKLQFGVSRLSAKARVFFRRGRKTAKPFKRNGLTDGMVKDPRYIEIVTDIDRTFSSSSSPP